MNILVLLFTLTGLVCVFKGILCLRTTEQIGLRVIFKKQTPVVVLRNYILILLGIILILFGLHTIPHYILETKLRDSLVVSDRVIKVFNKNFDLVESSQFTIPVIRPYDNNLSTYKVGSVATHDKTVRDVLLFKTKTSSGFIGFSIPQESVRIVNSNGTKLIAHKKSKFAWHLWPCRYPYFVYELR